MSARGDDFVFSLNLIETWRPTEIFQCASVVLSLPLPSATSPINKHSTTPAFYLSPVNPNRVWMRGWKIWLAHSCSSSPSNSNSNALVSSFWRKKKTVNLHTLFCFRHDEVRPPFSLYNFPSRPPCLFIPPTLPLSHPCSTSPAPSL